MAYDWANMTISYCPLFTKFTKNVTAALLLTNLLKWSSYSMAHGQAWFRRSDLLLSRSLGVTTSAVCQGRKILTGLGVIKTVKQGTPPRLYYKVQRDQLAELMDVPDFAEVENTYTAIQQPDVDVQDFAKRSPELVREYLFDMIPITQDSMHFSPFDDTEEFLKLLQGEK